MLLYYASFAYTLYIVLNWLAELNLSKKVLTSLKLYDHSRFEKLLDF